MMERQPLERPVLAVDVVLFAIERAQLQVLLLRRQEEPFQHAAALPGVAVRSDETLENAAKRALRDKARLTEERDAITHLEQLAAFDGLFRDPRGRTVSVAYLGLLRNKPAHRADLFWKPVHDITPHSLPFDHAEIVETAVIRLQGKLRYTTIAKGFVNETFRIDDLQDVYEAILGRTVNRANFRAKLLKMRIIEQVSILTDAVGKYGGRPPHLDRFAHHAVEIVERELL